MPAEQAEAVARAQGISVNQLFIDSLSIEISRVRKDAEILLRVSRIELLS